MTYEQITNRMATYKRGSFLRVTYKSELPVRAKQKDVTIEKVTTCTCRTGIKYSHIKAVAERVTPAQPTKTVASTWKWDENFRSIIKESLIKDQKYVSFAPIKRGHHTVVRYFMNGREIPKAEAVEYVIPSYWAKNGPVDVYDVKLENVIKIQ